MPADNWGDYAVMRGERLVQHLLLILGLYAAAGEAASGETFSDCPQCPEMVLIPEGKFFMGAELQESRAAGLTAYFQTREQPRHQVTISKPFSISKYEISKAQFAQFVEETGYAPSLGCWVFIGTEWIIDEKRSWQGPHFEQSDDHPVTCVNWHDAVAYTDWLSRRTGQNYRLLSEAEWEYAVRAGTNTPYWFGASADQICDYVNLGDLETKDEFRWHETKIKYDVLNDWTSVPCRDGYATTAPITFGFPNSFEVHNMLGNVTEWVADCWHDDYRTGPFTEEARRLSGDCGYRAMRGQGWTAIAASTRAAFRGKMLATDRRFNFGIRIAREIRQQPDR